MHIITCLPTSLQLSSIAAERGKGKMTITLNTCCCNSQMSGAARWTRSVRSSSSSPSEHSSERGKHGKDMCFSEAWRKQPVQLAPARMTGGPGRSVQGVYSWKAWTLPCTKKQLSSVGMSIAALWLWQHMLFAMVAMVVPKLLLSTRCS